MDLRSKLHPYKTPGYGLGIAVNRARQLSNKKAETGDQIDDEHVAFAPYVDALFVDKRTFEHLKQELRDRPKYLLAPPDGRVCVAGSIDELKCKLESFE